MTEPMTEPAQQERSRRRSDAKDPIPVDAIVDVEGLVPVADERYRDMLWHIGLDLGEDDSLTLYRPENVRAMFWAQVIARGSVRGDRLHVGRLRRTRGDLQEWPHIPLPTEAAREEGQRLFDRLPLAAHGDLRPATSAARLRLSLDSEVARDLPWELLVDSDLRFVGLHNDVSVIRDATRRYSCPPQPRSGPLIVLVVVSSPKTGPVLDVDREIEAVAPEPSSEIQVECCSATSLEAFHAALDRVKPHVVHYVGHGGTAHRDGFVMFHEDRADGRDGYTQWVTARQLADALPPSVRLLCLDTCVSRKNHDVRGLQRLAAAAVPLPTTIANLHAVTDRGAKAFWRACHRALALGDGDVTAAVGAGKRDAAAAASTADWASYGLWLRDAGPGLFERGPVAELSGRDDLEALYTVRLANDLAAAAGSVPSTAGIELLRVSVEVAREVRRFSGGEPSPPSSPAASSPWSASPPSAPSPPASSRPSSPPRRPSTDGSARLAEWCWVFDENGTLGAGVLIHPRLVLTTSRLGPIRKVRNAEQTSTPTAWISHPQQEVAAIVLAAPAPSPPTSLSGMPSSLRAVHFAKRGAVESMPRPIVRQRVLESAGQFGMSGARVEKGIVGAPVYAGSGTARELIGLYKHAKRGVGIVESLSAARGWIDEVAARHDIKLGHLP